MIFDTASADIILISYPSGGFGNFLYHILTEYAEQTVKVRNNFKFGSNGNSHKTNKYTNTYFHDPDTYIPEIAVAWSGCRIIILCDNGINNDSYSKISNVFPNATIVRAVIDREVRPVIYKTCIIKAMNTNILDKNKNQILSNWSDSSEDYAVRENFTLFYHNWPFGWEAVVQENIINVSLKELMDHPVNAISKLLTKVGLTIINKDDLTTCCADWISANTQYIDIYTKWISIEQALADNTLLELTDIIDLHDQGYINYCIERKYDVIIPVYDYKDWFADTDQVLDMIKKIKYVQN